MAKTTVLEIVQQILSDADGDNVNSISDTVESLQCADMLKDVFSQIVTGYDLHLHDTLQKLTATSSSTPTVMERPEGFYDIQWIKYDIKTTSGGDQKYQNIPYVTPAEFMDRTVRRTLSDSIVEAQTLPDSGHITLIRNDKAPSYFTVLDGYDDLVFDSYDSNLETNLQNSKSLAYGNALPTLTLTDGAVPNLPQNLMVLLRREVRAVYFDLYKDGTTREVDRTRRRAETTAQRHRRTIRNADNKTGPDYGRK
ncbi:hypothetical protein LCGC14_2110740 [marine sediment metagenome]|uniref:Uncharacterized protein n=1 Tax=marine sediment metagenome TaxID=412755 RepID=A0A0F9EUC2_9ZZZZ